MNKELSLLLKKLRRQKYPKLEIMKKLEEGAKEEEVDINCFLDIEVIEFINENNSEVYKFEYLCSHLRDNKDFENEVTPYKDNIIAIVEKIDTNPTLKCFVKFYEDIDYQHL